MTIEQHIVGAGNEEQYSTWNGEEGERWVANAAYFDAAVRHHHDRLMEAAAIGADDWVLDIGSGTGQCTCDAARRAFQGTAIGIDLSLSMIRAAERSARSHGVPNPPSSTATPRCTRSHPTPSTSR